MNRFRIMATFAFVVSIACLGQAEAGTLSGTVLDTEGAPISGFTINLSPVFQTSKTDENGAFSFTDVAAGRMQIMVPPQFGENQKPTFNLEPDHELVSIKIGGITIYQGMPPPFGGISFAMEPGSHLKDIEVTVRPRMRIRARVVFKDGTPVTNASISTVVTEGNGTNSTGGNTDSEGYFVHYLDYEDEAAFYKVTVKYKGLSAESEEFEIKPGGRLDGLVLTLDGDAPPAAAPPKPEQPKDSLPGLLRKLTGTPTPTDKAKATEATGTETPKRPNRRMPRPPWEKDAWAVNPASGHAYKKIRCRDLKDAKDRATDEGAYLVAINDEAEQKWLSSLFGNHLYWIGLSDAEKEGEWVWQNGEPLSYTNWGAKHSFPRSTLSAEEKDSAVMTFVDGQWHAVGPGDMLWRMTKSAILEKEMPQTDEASEGK